MENFDFIIIGAGSAGCVLANRLSEDPKNKVLLMLFDVVYNHNTQLSLVSSLFFCLYASR